MSGFRKYARISTILLLLGLYGCGRGGLPTAPLEGKVLYRGKPLTFGSVAFMPKTGPPARGVIQPDGTFHLSTYGNGDGAVLGEHQVQVACYQNQNPDGPPPPFGRPGKLYIPVKYIAYDTSGLCVEVKAQNEPVVLELQD